MFLIKRGLAEFLMVSFAKVLNGVLAILFNVLLLRYLGPENFGIFSLCVVGILYADGTIGSALDMGVMQLATKQHKYQNSAVFCNVEIASLLLKFIFTLLLCLLLLFGAEALSKLLFHRDDLGSIIWLTALSASGLLLLRTLQVHCQLSSKLGIYSLLDLLNTGLKFGGIAFVIATQTVTLENILFFFASAPFFVSLFGLAFYLTRSSITFHGHINSICELINNVKWILLTYLITATISRLDIFLLNLFSNLKEVGIFYSGFIFASIPELLGSYIAIILNPRVIPYHNTGKFLSFYRKFQIICFYGSICFMIIIYFLIDPLSKIFFPSAYSESTAVLFALLPGCLATMAIFPLTLPFLLYVKPKFFLIMDCLFLPILVLFYIATIKYYGAFGAAWVTSIAKVIKSLLAQYMAYRLASSKKF